MRFIIGILYLFPNPIHSNRSALLKKWQENPNKIKEYLFAKLLPIAYSLITKKKYLCGLMSLAKNYSPQESENKWYKHWNESGYFNSQPNDKEAYTIVMPPPNVTGILHMGHALNNSVQDVLIRFAKLRGYNTCWVPGTDHASIATEAKVVAMLKEKGIDKNNLSREEFLEHAFEWKEKYGGIILQQLKKLGCALDWNRVNFTMDDHYYDAVIDVFIDLYKKGKIYRGVKMINWDPSAKTALSDEEVVHKQVNSKLVYINYPMVNDTSQFMTIATVRPETILGDVAIAVHPEDPRYKDLVGKKCLVPLINREIPIIADDYIDIEFGTGCLKVTPAHDINDFNIGQKHNLEVIDTLNEDGTMSEAAQLYIGQDRFDVRKQIVIDLEEKGFVIKVEDYQNQVGFSERTDAVIEPRLSMQWWCDMKDMAKPALDVVMSDEVKFYPSKFKNTYKHWMDGDNIRDWCISRQLWWGQRIPAFYDDQGNTAVAKTQEEAFEQLKIDNEQLTIDEVKQDEDVLDTWFSSWLWPLEVFEWNKNKEQNGEVDYYYPTTTLVTAPDIIFFWVARMIMAGMEYKNAIPFKQVYFTGIVRDSQGRKMSKQLGNSPDLLGLIEKHGADTVRFGVMIAAPAGNDVLFDESGIEQGEKFINKIWNALKLLKMFEEKEGEGELDKVNFAHVWFGNQLEAVKADVEKDLKQFKLSEALKKIYSLIWNDYCSWYLEFIKPSFDGTIDATSLNMAKGYLDELLKLLHPFMPFVTEEMYHLVSNRESSDDLMTSSLAPAKGYDKGVIEEGNLLQAIITQVRDARIKNGLSFKQDIELHFAKQDESKFSQFTKLLASQVNASSIHFTDENVKGIKFVVQDVQGVISADVKIDTAAQLEQLQKDLKQAQGFLVSVEKKLGNERFVQNAKPEIVEVERKKKADAEEKIKALEESIGSLE